MIRRQFICTLAVSSMLFVASSASAMGLLLPNDQGLAPLAVESHRVEIQVNGSAAVTHIDQVFRNNTSSQLEATFVFPLPPESTVSEFALYMNGVRVEGEVLEATQARQIYQNIVNRVRDPGLVEYVDGRIFQARIFPVPANGTQRVELTFAQVLERQGDLQRLVYPLRTGRTTATTLTDFTLSVEINSAEPLRTIYSPTHDVDVVRRDEHTAVVGLEQMNADLEQDFVLYFNTSSDDVGLSLMTFDGDGEGGEDGYFLLVLAPRLENEGEAPPTDVTFVVDTSGSMAGEKLAQAQDTLRYCISQLRPEDRFNILRFSTTTRSVFDGLTPASAENITRARSFIDSMRAAGGTAIEEALTMALAQETHIARPHRIIFVTDGLPTVGQTDTQRLIEAVNAAEHDGTRIFTFGVGWDVDTILLDSVADGNGGVSDYVRPGEDLELAVSALYDRIRYPILTDIEVDFGVADVYDTFPRTMPDLFAGHQIVLTGRYRNLAESEIAMRGQTVGVQVSYSFEKDFGGDQVDGAHPFDFIPQLWATRKIGYLVDQIRLNGETAELRTEVMNMGIIYGLVTPYTSYLAADDSEFAGTWPATSRGGEWWGEGEVDELTTIGGWGSSTSTRARSEDADMPAFEPVPIAASGSFRQSNSGRDAVVVAEEADRMQNVEFADQRNAMRFVGSRQMNLGGDGNWRQATSQMNATQRVNIRYLSPAYFRLLELRSDIASVVALGERVEFQLNSRVIIEIDATGLQELDAATEALFF
jgi:Ca-activated chloride channel family protein